MRVLLLVLVVLTWTPAVASAQANICDPRWLETASGADVRALLRGGGGGTPHHFASSIFVFFLVRDRLFRSTDPGAWHTRHRHWDVEWVEGRSADDGMSPKALASLGSRSPRTVSHGRQPALRVLRCAPVLRMTAATDRARSPCGPAGKAGPRSTACKCDACEPLRCRGTPSTTPGRDPRVPSRLRAAAMGHPDTKATGRGAGLT